MQILNKWIEEDSPRAEGLRERNWELADSMRNAKIHRIAQKYPLSKFLSRDTLKAIQAQLRHGHSYCNEAAAKRIIEGRGTLIDLYTVSFEINFADLNPSFRIIDPVGTVRFGDEKRDALCDKFDDEIWAVYTARQSNKEIKDNQKYIDEFDRRCEIRDSIYMDIMLKFEPSISRRIDSLESKKKKLLEEKLKLAQRMNARHK